MRVEQTVPDTSPRAYKALVCAAPKSIGIVTGLLLGGRSMGFSPCRPSRSTSPTGEPLAEADGYCRLRLNGCVLPGTEAVPSAFSPNPSKQQPAGANWIFR